MHACLCVFAYVRLITSNNIVIKSIFHFLQCFCSWGSVRHQLRDINESNTPVQPNKQTKTTSFKTKRPIISPYFRDHGIIVDADVASFLNATVHPHLERKRENFTLKRRKQTDLTDFTLKAVCANGSEWALQWNHLLNSFVLRKHLIGNTSKVNQMVILKFF